MIRVFQNFDIYPGYLRRLHKMAGSSNFERITGALHSDRFIALHMLKPTLEQDPSAAFAIGADASSQRAWARAHGLPSQASAEDILLAQIEEHRADVFYNHDPLRFGSSFVKRLPSHVRSAIAWRAAPSPGADFERYDWVVCNFPSIIEHYRRRGWRAAWFAPAHDPAMDPYAAVQDRPIDVLFVGTYSRHHLRRAGLIDRLASLSDQHEVRIHLYASRLTRLADTPFGLVGPLRRHRRPKRVRRLASGPLFGRALYSAIASAKIVVNCAIDMAGADRGNMRCWETLGCGALMLSDVGVYPEGMADGVTMSTYGHPDELSEKAIHLLRDEPSRQRIAAAGHDMVRSRYSKERQWGDFLELLR
jgi:hypothetical protein